MGTKTFTEGQFCWQDLSTTDSKGAKAFYTKVFNWQYKDIPTPYGVYSYTQLGDVPVGALAELGAERRKQGVPTHWLTYIAVQNVDATTKKATTLGAQVLAPEMEVGDAGRMAVLKDPTGATFALWQGKANPGYDIDPSKHGAPCWHELMTTNIEQAAPFYTNLFGWDFKASEGLAGHKYYEIEGKGGLGGMFQITKEMKNVPSHWMPYFTALDCDATAKVASQNGAKLMVPPTDIPHVGRMAVIDDPQGGGFAIITLKH